MALRPRLSKERGKYGVVHQYASFIMLYNDASDRASFVRCASSRSAFPCLHWHKVVSVINIDSNQVFTKYQEGRKRYRKRKQPTPPLDQRC